MQVSRLVNSFYTSNTYLISDAAGEGVWLVDCGDYASQVKPLLDGRTVLGVFLTHTHSDHIYGLVDSLLQKSSQMILESRLWGMPG